MVVGWRWIVDGDPSSDFLVTLTVRGDGEKEKKRKKKRGKEVKNVSFSFLRLY